MRTAAMLLVLVAVVAVLLLPLGPLGLAVALGGLAFSGLALIQYVLWGRWVRSSLGTPPEEGTSQSADRV